MIATGYPFQCLTGYFSQTTKTRPLLNMPAQLRKITKTGIYPGYMVTGRVSAVVYFWGMLQNPSELTP